MSRQSVTISIEFYCHIHRRRIDNSSKNADAHLSDSLSGSKNGPIGYFAGFYARQGSNRRLSRRPESKLQLGRTWHTERRSFQSQFPDTHLIMARRKRSGLTMLEDGLDPTMARLVAAGRVEALRYLLFCNVFCTVPFLLLAMRR